MKNHLVEERYIADEVTKVTSEICNKISEHVKNTPIITPIRVQGYETRHIFYNRFDIQITIEGVNFTVRILIIRYEQGGEKDLENHNVEMVIRNVLKCSQAQPNLRLIDLSFIYNQYGLDWHRIESTIQHEVGHCYEDIKIHSNHSKTPFQWKMFYRKGIGLLESKNEIEKAVGIIIYNASKMECDAVVNEYYREISRFSSFQDSNDIIRYDTGSSLVQAIQNIQNAINLIAHNEKECKSIINKINLGLKFSEIVKYGKRGIKYLEKRRLPIISKALEDAPLSSPPLTETIDAILNKKPLFQIFSK